MDPTPTSPTARPSRLPWRRILTEGGVIVASILLAFAIDAGWAQRKNAQEEQKLLLSLDAEIQSNIEKLEGATQIRTALLDATSTLLDASEGTIELPTSEAFDRLLGSLVWGHFTNPDIGVLDGIVQSGKLSLITDDSLRSRIASLNSEYELLAEVEMQHFATFKETLMPFLYPTVHIGQITNAQPTQPGSPGGLGLQPTLPVSQRRDHLFLLDNQEFLGIVTHLTWDQNDNLGVLQQTKERLSELSEQIAATVD